MLGLAVLLWLATALAPCFMSTPHCDGMDGAMACAHAGTANDCDTACLQGDSRSSAVAIFNFPAFVPLLLATVALIVRQPVVTQSVAPTRRRSPDTPLHLQFARLLI